LKPSTFFNLPPETVIFALCNTASMIIKKLAAPFINNKILHEAEHCYIATAAISEAGFDFVRTRVSPKCKIEIVTGLDELTSPMVLKRIWKHYLDRIDLRIYTKNFLHANVYIFDLPYRKAVAFTGSGSFTLEGLKDHEEIFTKTIDAKEIEELKSWFTGYFEFAEPLSETMIAEYELLYPAMKQREIASRQEKKQFVALTASGFNWDTIKFKNQYFKKEDYGTLGNVKAALDTEEIRNERSALRDKLLQLHTSLKVPLAALGLHENSNAEHIVSSLDPLHHRDQKLRALWLTYGRGEAELKKYSPEAQPENFMTLQVVLQQKDIGLWLVPGKPNGGREDREYFQKQLQEIPYRNTFFNLLKGLGAGYWIEIAGERKPVETFLNEDALWEFTKADDWRYYAFVIGRNYSPGDAALSNETIATTISKEFEKLVLLYRHMKEPSLYSDPFGQANR
jgi:hypothetical protein